MNTEETTRVPVCPAGKLGPGERIVFEHGDWLIGVFNIEGELFAIEDRCSHDDGPLAEGEVDERECTVICPRHGSVFDLRTGVPRTLPAYEPVSVFPVRVVDDMITVEV